MDKEHGRSKHHQLKKYKFKKFITTGYDWSERGRSRTRTVQDDIDEVSDNRKYLDYEKNPSKYRFSFRSESPPPKRYRTRRGINRGKPKACSWCRPQICKNMENKSQIRKEITLITKGLHAVPSLSLALLDHID